MGYSKTGDGNVLGKDCEIWEGMNKSMDLERLNFKNGNQNDGHEHYRKGHQFRYGCKYS